jgi:hypothetical protein
MKRRMRVLSCVVFSGVSLLLPAAAAAQSAVISGNASDVTLQPGLYAAPLVPLVSTPSIALGSPSLQVGASNATAGNVAGAANATLSIDTSGPSATFAPPMWYGQAASPESGPEGGEETSSTQSAGPQTEQGFQFGVATFQSSYGVARLAAWQRQLGRAKRVYTNADIARLDGATGIVKFGEKTERME